MTYEEWVSSVPNAITSDSLWRMEVYRMALFLGDLAWHDGRKLVKVPLGSSLADQLYRATSGISANISEGYSRPSSKEQARFYSYALGSAREGRDWYFKSRHVLGQTTVDHRLGLLVPIIRQLTRLVTTHRSKSIREHRPIYRTKSLPKQT